EGCYAAFTALQFDMDFLRLFRHNERTSLVKGCVVVNTTLTLFSEQSREVFYFSGCGFRLMPFLDKLRRKVIISGRKPQGLSPHDAREAGENPARTRHCKPDEPIGPLEGKPPGRDGGERGQARRPVVRNQGRLARNRGRLFAAPPPKPHPFKGADPHRTAPFVFGRGRRTPFLPARSPVIFHHFGRRKG
ncbi:hypothetical protein C8D99_1011, partial [Aminivibrio pyruvatiphilus]